MDYFRWSLETIHVFMAILAYGSVLHADIRVLFHKIDVLTLKVTTRIVTFGLVMLYITGAGMIYIDFGHVPSFAELLDNPKLTVKLITVFGLTINGVLLSMYVLDKLERHKYISKRKDIIFAASGGFSIGSWLVAVFLGKAKILAPLIGLEGFLTIYLTVLTGCIVLALLMARFHPLDYGSISKKDIHLSKHDKQKP